jgi:2-polyprenyl-3-methyl-5-hydroxy-6-metoxy-1,4-benzoquinol methylase
MDLKERTAGTTTRHPWETVRAEFFTRVVGERAGGALEVLDLGAGDGFVAGELARVLPHGSSITCVDAAYSDDDLADTSGGIERSRERPARRFDAILMLDVIEHVSDDVALVRDVTRDQLRPDGWVLVSVPAYPRLYTHHDTLLGHHRRYTARALRTTLETAGLRIVRAGSLFGSLVAPRAAQKAGELLRGVASDAPIGVSSWQHGRTLTRAVTAALRADAWVCDIGARWSVPLPGLSLWAICALP